jgi:hypothetical protein
MAETRIAIKAGPTEQDVRVTIPELGIEPSIGGQKQNQLEIQAGCVPFRWSSLYHILDSTVEG